MKRGRIKRQPNGLIEPYTVMMQGNPRVVVASSPEEAEKMAAEEVESEQLTEQEVDGN